MKTPVKIALLVAALLGAAPAALSDPTPVVRGGGGGGRGGGGRGGGGARSRPASSRGSVRNTRPAPQPRASRPASRPTRTSRPAQPARPARTSQPVRSTRPAQPARSSSTDRSARSAASDRPARSAPTATATSTSSRRAAAAGGFVGSRTPPRGTKVGTSISNLPVSAQSVTMRGSTFHYAGGVFHTAGAGGYRVTRAPVGAVVRRPLPGGCWRYWWGRRWYWYYGGVYYGDYDYDDDDDDEDEPAAATEPAAETAPAGEAEPATEAEPAAEPEPTEVPPEPLEYVVVEPTIGAKVPYLPEGANAVQVEGANLFEYQGTYYKPTLVDGEIAYEVVAPPK